LRDRAMLVNLGIWVIMVVAIILYEILS